MMFTRLIYAVRVAYFFARARLRFRYLRGHSLAAFQNRRARRMILYATKRSKYHARRLKSYDAKNWREIQPIDKHDMMDNFEQYNTVGMPLDSAMQVAATAEENRDFSEKVNGLTVGLSSGTSGARGIFAVSEDEQIRWAGTILSYTVPSIRLRGWKVAMLMRSNSNLYQTLNSHWIQLYYFDMAMPLSDMVRKLNDCRPDILVGTASLLNMLRIERTHNRLTIAPTRLISVAEVLEPQDKEALEGSYSVPVHQIYQCTEGLIAACCSHGSLHILEDIVSVDLEVITENERFVRGIVIVTDLWRSTQPIIRYRLNDVVVVDKKLCSCGSGFRVLAQIEGRCDDILYTRDRDNRSKPVFSDVIRRILLLASPDILDYQVIQRELTSWDVYVDIPSHIKIEDLAALIIDRAMDVLSANHLVAPSIRVRAGVPKRYPGDKKRRIQRTFPISHQEFFSEQIA